MPLSARTGTPATIRVGRAVYDKKSMLCLGRIVKGREQQWPEKLNQRKTKPPVPVGFLVCTACLAKSRQRAARPHQVA